MGTPVLVRTTASICTGESYKNAVEAYLRQGRVFEGSGPSLQLEFSRENVRRAIDIHEGEVS